jgi:hypothetical protein
MTEQLASHDAASKPRHPRAAKTISEFCRTWPLGRALVYELIREGKLRA